MSVTGIAEGRIPHGLRGYRQPYNCRCEVCRAANAQYSREKRAEYRQAARDDELAAKRATRKVPARRRAPAKSKARSTRTRAAESSDSVGPMERAVIAECDGLPRALTRPTLVIAARNLAKIVDTPNMSSIHTSTTKQIMAILADLHGDTDKAKATGRRKSGGRLATVGSMTKVKRA